MTLTTIRKWQVRNGGECGIYTHTYLETPQTSLRLPDERSKIIWLTTNTINKELGSCIYACIPQCTKGIPGAG